MTATVFLARPITGVDTDESAYAIAINDALADAGIRIRFGGAEHGVDQADTAERNIESIRRAGALVALLPRRSSPVSSVWIEIGAALMARIPVILVATERAAEELPFLLDGLRVSSRSQVTVVSARAADATANAIRTLLASDGRSSPS